MEALRHTEKLVRQAINQQVREHNRWESFQGFDWEALEDEPSRLFWWMIRQPRYMDHIYNVVLFNRGNRRHFTTELQDLVMKNFAGATNEIISYFNHAAAIRNEDEGLILLDHGFTRDIIVQDAIYARKQGFPYTRPIQGKMIGNYDPDGLLVTLYAQEDEETGFVSESDHQVVASFEASMIDNQSIIDPIKYQQTKVDHLKIARTHHPHLFESAYIQLGMPTSKETPSTFEDEVEPIDLAHSIKDVHTLMFQFFRHYTPHNRKRTLADLMPELQSHPTLRGYEPLPHGVKDGMRAEHRRPAYT